MHYPQPNGSPRHVQGDAITPDQGDLFAQPADEPTPVTLTEAFLAFHDANVDVYWALRKLAFEWLDEGKKKCSITLLYNVVRWRMSLTIEGDGAFELNDHYQAFYARALMHFEPRLRGLFDIRRAPEADAWIATHKAQGQVAA